MQVMPIFRGVKYKTTSVPMKEISYRDLGSRFANLRPCLDAAALSVFADNVGVCFFKALVLLRPSCAPQSCVPRGGEEGRRHGWGAKRGAQLGRPGQSRH